MSKPCVCCLDLPKAEATITELRAQLADASHRAIVASDEAETAKGILRKQANAGARVSVHGLLTRSTRGPIALTDAEAALFDTITKEAP